MVGATSSKLGARAAICGLLVLAAGAAAAVVVDFQSTVVVGPVGTPTDNGTALLTALGGIVASADAPKLLKLEPGIYDVGVSPAVLPAHVDLEGSGRGVTLVRGSVVGAFPAGQGVVSLGAGSELRSLTVENSFSGDADTAAVVLTQGARARDIAAVAGGAFSLNRALLVAFDASPSTARVSLHDVTATAVTRAVGVFFPGLEAENLTATGQQGMLVSSGPVVTLRDSVVRGTEFSALVTNLVTAADFVATQLDGELSCPDGVCRCVAAYDGDFRRLDAACRLPPGRRPF